MHLPCRFTLACILFITTISPPLVAQEQASEDLWLKRAESLTYDLLKDAESLTTFDRAILLGRLAETWWKTDPTNAQTYLSKGIELLSPPSDLVQEGPAITRKRLAAARLLYNIAMRLDDAVSNKLLEAIKADKDTYISALEESLNFHLTGDKNPKRIAELGSELLRAGASHQLTALIWELSIRDKSRAEALFKEVLLAAEKSQNPQLLSSVGMAAYPGMQNPSGRKKIMPDELCARLLTIYASVILRQPSSETERRASCELALIVSPLLDEFNRLLPTSAPSVRQMITTCQAVIGPSVAQPNRQQVTDSLREQPLRTVEDFLKAASEAQDKKAGALYQLRAASLAARQKDYGRAIKILDDITPAAREAAGIQDGWEKWRWDFALSAALSYLEGQDFQSMEQIINTTPANLRPVVGVFVAEKLVEKGYASRATELLTDARSRLGKDKISNAEDLYVVLSRLYAKVIPQDAPAVFSEMVFNINSEHRLKPTDEKEKNIEAEMWGPIALPAALFEIDEMGIKYSLSMIVPAPKRVAMRLGLLGASLQQQKVKSVPKAPPAKGKTDANREPK